MSGIQIALMICLLLAIVLGFKTNVNIGLFAMMFSYILGSFFMGMKPSAILALWPIKIFFILFSVNLFYSFANANGTLEKVAMNILYRFRRVPALFPFVIFVISALLTFMGAGVYACISLLVPISYVLCEKTGMHPLVGTVAVSCGSITTNNFITTPSGAVVRELINTAGFGDQALRFTMYICITTAICFTINYVGLYLICGGHKIKGNSLEVAVPEPFNHVQKLNLILILINMLILLLPPVLHSIFPSSAVLTFLNRYIDVGFVSILMVILSLLLKVGEQKEVFKLIPWNTIIMISGIGIIVSLAAEAGVTDYLVSTLGNSGSSPIFVTLFMSFVAGLMSIFSSTTGVVLPTLYPLVEGISIATGTSIAALFVGIQLGSLSTGISPFSSGGGLILGMARDDRTARFLYPRMIVLAGAFFAATLLQISVMYLFFR